MSTTVAEKIPVGYSTLPTELVCSRGYNAREILVVAGVKFCGGMPNNDMLQIVELPKGWREIATYSPRWSHLVDDKGHTGRIRAKIFSDHRYTRLNLVTRFSIFKDTRREAREHVAITYVLDGGKKIIFKSKTLNLPTKDDNFENWETSQSTVHEATKWLEENYPDWKNPGAYWDL